jgi:hypothetical protein
MKKIALALTVFVVALTACQKEPSFENPNSTPGGGSSGGGSGSGTSGTKLVRMGTRTGTDSITLDFTYNNAGFISRMNYSGTVSGQAFTAQIRLVRNAANIITSLVSTSGFYAAIGVDSIVTNYVYDATASRYKYSVANYTYLGVQSSDSAVYAYDAAGRFVSGISYHNDGTGYEADTKSEYTYTGNNVATEKSYTYNGSSFDLDESDSYDQYDSKTNPLLFPTDAPVLGITTFYPANNAVKKTVTDYTSGSAVSASATATYTYNTKNFPTYMVSSDGSSTSTSTYYYQ